MAQCPRMVNEGSSGKDEKANDNNDLDESMRNAIKNGLALTQQPDALTRWFSPVTFAQFLNHNSDNANVTRDRKNPSQHIDSRVIRLAEDGITIDYVDSATKIWVARD